MRTPTPSRHFRTGWLFLLLPALALSLTACDEVNPFSSDDTVADVAEAKEGTIPGDQIYEGCSGGKDCIPALTDPSTSDAQDVSFLDPSSRVIGVQVGEKAIAVPHNILWWHEIANISVEGLNLAVTLCPLTGSSLTFNRSTIGGAEFGVSGLLFKNNLIMYDRRSTESLWPQMMREAGKGEATGTKLEMYPSIEISWEGWKELHPNSAVVNRNTGHQRNYNRYPYGDYDRKENGNTLYPMPDGIDARRAPKERVLGIPDGEGGGIAFPFGELADGSATKRVVPYEGADEPIVVFWHGAFEGAMAYRPVLEGEELDFTVQEGEIVDVGTGSTWTVDGRAISGPMSGKRLEAVPNAYTAFWFAWAGFQPDTEIWTTGG